MPASTARKKVQPRATRLERVLKMGRGCVEDQPQCLPGIEFLGNAHVLHLVEDDTAALRDFQNTLLDRLDGGFSFAASLEL